MRPTFLSFPSNFSESRTQCQTVARWSMMTTPGAVTSPNCWESTSSCVTASSLVSGEITCREYRHPSRRIYLAVGASTWRLLRRKNADKTDAFAATDAKSRLLRTAYSAVRTISTVNEKRYQQPRQQRACCLVLQASAWDGDRHRMKTVY